MCGVFFPRIWGGWHLSFSHKELLEIPAGSSHELVHIPLRGPWLVLVMHTKLKLKSKLRNKWIPLSPMNCLLDWFLVTWREVCAHIDPSHPALCYQLLPQDVAVVRSFLRFLFHPSPFKPSTSFPIRNRWETFAAGYCQMEQILITTSASSVYSLRNSPPPPAPFCHLMCSTLVSDADVSSWCV